MHFNSVFKGWINNVCICFRVSQFYFINTALHEDSSKIELYLSSIINNLSIGSKSASRWHMHCFPFCLCLINKHYLWLLFDYLNISFCFSIYFTLLRCVDNPTNNLTTSLSQLMTSKSHHSMMLFLFY